MSQTRHRQERRQKQTMFREYWYDVGICIQKFNKKHSLQFLQWKSLRIGLNDTSRCWERTSDSRWKMVSMFKERTCDKSMPKCATFAEANITSICGKRPDNRTEQKYVEANTAWATAVNPNTGEIDLFKFYLTIAFRGATSLKKSLINWYCKPRRKKPCVWTHLVASSIKVRAVKWYILKLN